MGLWALSSPSISPTTLRLPSWWTAPAELSLPDSLPRVDKHEWSRLGHDYLPAGHYSPWLNDCVKSHGYCPKSLSFRRVCYVATMQRITEFGWCFEDLQVKHCLLFALEETDPDQLSVQGLLLAIGLKLKNWFWGSQVHSFKEPTSVSSHPISTFLSCYCGNSKSGIRARP